MKKQLYILLLAAICFSSSGQSLCKQQLRSLYLQSLHHRAILDSFIALLQRPGLSPAEECYYGICQGMKAQYAESMWSKLRLVQKSKALLNDAIERDPRDPELRFMRFTLEHYIPSYLGMSGDIKDDLAAIFSHTDFLEDNADIKKMALDFILYTKRCTADQVRMVQSSLIELGRKSIAQK
jgi:hypothetical protein